MIISGEGVPADFCACKFCMQTQNPNLKAGSCCMPNMGQQGALLLLVFLGPSLQHFRLSQTSLVVMRSVRKLWCAHTPLQLDAAIRGSMYHFLCTTTWQALGQWLHPVPRGPGRIGLPCTQRSSTAGEQERRK